jgi:hypothetical protein
MRLRTLARTPRPDGKEQFMGEITEQTSAKNTARPIKRPRLPRVVRSVSPSAVAVSLSLLFGGAGFADAATGGAFLLGKPNHETSQASLSNDHGTPLSLVAPSGKAPLAVNRSVQVQNLNAQFVGGVRASQLMVTGGAGVTKFDHSIRISTGGTVVAATGPLRAGMYYVSASGELFINPSDIDAFCWIARSSSQGTRLAQSYVAGSGDFPVAEVSAASVTAGDTLQEVCVAGGNTGSAVSGADIFAIRITSSSNR